MKNIYYKTYQNVSGSFTCDQEGSLLSFEPTPENRLSEPIVREVYSCGPSYYKMAVRSLIIPEGVVAIEGDFFRYGYVQEILSFPTTLRRIGDNCAFANCSLPDVVIPSGVNMIGSFAFGDSKIKSLCLTRVFECEYLRQFKGAEIDKLILPESSCVINEMHSILNHMYFGAKIDMVSLGDSEPVSFDEFLRGKH